MQFGEITWTPAIGDPGFIGWFTVFAYFSTAWLCMRAYRLEQGNQDSSNATTVPRLLQAACCDWRNLSVYTRRSILWLILTAAMCGLGINKQLDLQTLFTEVGRELSKIGGWYEFRKTAQIIFIGIVAILGVVALLMLNWLVRADFPGLMLPLSGLALIVCFVIVRAASFSGFDQFISLTLYGVKMNWVMELAGIGLIALGALRQTRWTYGKRQRTSR